MSQCKFIYYKTCTTSVEDVNIGESVCNSGQEDMENLYNFLSLGLWIEKSLKIKPILFIKILWKKEARTQVVTKQIFQWAKLREYKMKNGKKRVNWGRIQDGD
jgi:hypothetical protein